MYGRGDKVYVEGFMGDVAELRVWEVKPKGFTLCSEEGYRKALRGEEFAGVGFPTGDIKRLVEGRDAT